MKNCDYVVGELVYYKGSSRGLMEVVEVFGDCVIIGKHSRLLTSNVRKPTESELIDHRDMLVRYW